MMTAERKEAVEELDRAVNASPIAGIGRTDKIELGYETARTLRALIDDLDTDSNALPLAEDAYLQCDTKLKDALVEIENLRRWKQEQLTVTAWWQAIDDYVRKSPDAPLGENVSAIALRWLQERAELKRSNAG